MGSYRSLKAWQHARRLAARCRTIAKTFPPEERFGLADQLRRAANGAALQIAEGKGRSGAVDYRRFLVMARASLDEVDAALQLARDASYLSAESHIEVKAIRDEAARTLFGLIVAVERRMGSPDRPSLNS